MEKKKITDNRECKSIFKMYYKVVFFVCLVVCLFVFF